MRVPPRAEKSIRPLKPGAQHLQIIAATEIQGVIREDGTVISWSDLPGIVKAEKGILATNCAANLLNFLEVFHKEDPLWQVRVTIREKQIARFDERIRVSKPVIGFLGFMAPPGVSGRRRETNYWQILDPTVFSDDPKAGMEAAEILAWAIDVRDWCDEQGIRIKPTAGGLAGQLLRHPKFYPEDRRRMPAATNEKARPALPGNHYALRAETNQRYVADYIDQQSAHHSAVLGGPLPDAETYAMGFYQYEQTPDGADDTYPLKLPERKWCDITDIPETRYGLLWARVWIPGLRKFPINWETGAQVEEFRPDWASTPGWRHDFIFTNEIPYLYEIGGRVEYVTAAWLSNHADTGLPAYAEWSLAETAKADALRKPWLKKVLLTTYGLLAVKPTHFEVGWRKCKNGTKQFYPIGGDMMEFETRRTSKAIPPRTAHVIQRGMIEARTRLRSIELANNMLAQGEHVLCIYGDGILVRTLPWRRRQEELLPKPWRIKERVTNLRFISEQAFDSREITRLPGIPMAARAEFAMARKDKVSS